MSCTRLCVAIMGEADGKFEVEVVRKCVVKIAVYGEWDILYIGPLRSEAELHACLLILRLHVTFSYSW
jgi:hypothetical protein